MLRGMWRLILCLLLATTPASAAVALDGTAETQLRLPGTGLVLSSRHVTAKLAVRSAALCVASGDQADVGTTDVFVQANAPSARSACHAQQVRVVSHRLTGRGLFGGHGGDGWPGALGGLPPLAPLASLPSLGVGSGEPGDHGGDPADTLGTRTGMGEGAVAASGAATGGVALLTPMMIDVRSDDAGLLAGVRTLATLDLPKATLLAAALPQLAPQPAPVLAAAPAPTPLPPAAWLFGSALAAMAVRRRPFGRPVR